MKYINKILLTTLVVAGCSAPAFAQSRGIINSTAAQGTTSLTNVIKQQDGSIVLQSMNYNMGTNVSTALTFIFPDRRTIATNAANTATSVTVRVDSNGKIGGLTPAANDWAFIVDSSTNNVGTQLALIAAVTTFTTNGTPPTATYQRDLQFVPSVSCAAGDTVHLAPVPSRVLSKTITASANNVLYEGAGTYNAPVAIKSVTTTAGAHGFSGYWVLENP